MKKINIILTMITIIALLFCLNQVFAFSNFDVDNVNSSATASGDGIQAADVAVKRIWNTVTLILQILAVAAIVIAGVKYMFASADQKADIKKQTITLIIGAILVFAASTIVSFIVKITQEVTTGSSIVSSYSVDSSGNAVRTSDYDGDGINDWADTIEKGTPDILNKKCTSLDGKIEQWKKDHPDDPDYN